MHIRHISFAGLLSILALGPLFSDEIKDPSNDVTGLKCCAIEIAEDSNLRCLPVQSNKDLNSSLEDKYLEGYMQALINSKFPGTSVKVTVRNGEVILADLPDDPKQEEKIRTIIRNTVACSAVPQEQQPTSDTSVEKTKKSHSRSHNGMWLPQSTVLFPTMVANPRQISFSVGYRMRDGVCGQNCAAVSFGDQFPLYRWSNVWKWGGDLQLELEGGVFAVFNEDKHSAPLVNADYYVGPSLTYATGPYAFRLRVYHISSHLGDEWIVNNPKIKRKNPSFEAVDFFTSYQLTDAVRVYGGPGVVVASDSSYRLKPLYVEYGMEVRPWRKNFKQLYGQPFLAMHFENWQEVDWKFNSTYALGWEWGKISGVGRKVRLFFEYHDGFSEEGQFSHRKTDYFSIRLAYGF